jgi:integrator complex subunit 4
MATALYPLARAAGLRGLAAVLDKGNAGSGVAEYCYGYAAELLRDEDEGIRLGAVRLVSFRRYSLFLLVNLYFQVSHLKN